MRLEVEVRGWPPGEWEVLAYKAICGASDFEPLLRNRRLETSIVFTDDQEARALNREWRGKDRATNVLSFPMIEHSRLATLPQVGPPELLGDIAIAGETCRIEAREKGISLADHATHLLVHGALHLAGHDHADDASAEAMEALETRILAKLGIADPYSGDNKTE